MPRISVEEFKVACLEGKPDIAGQFVGQELRGPSVLRDEAYTPKELLAQNLRIAYFTYPHLAHEFQALIEKLGPLPDRSIYATASHTFTPAKELADIPMDYLLPSNSEEEAIRRAQHAILNLLDDPALCDRFLKEINKQLERYFSDTYGQAFPNISDTLSSKSFFDGLAFPLASEDYVGIKKHSALQQVLSTILSEYDLATEAYQWAGFIPDEFAGKSIAQGHFFSESRGITSLLHGKLTHMIQWAMIILADKASLVPRHYVNQSGEVISLSMKQIFASIIKDNAWVELFDRVVDYKICFRDPVRLNSYLIQNPAYPALSATVTDTFCKMAIKNWKAHNELFNPTPCSLNEFIERLAQAPYWLNIPCPPLLAQTKADATNKGWTVEVEGDSFAVMKRGQPYIAPLPATRAVLQPA